MLSFFLNTFANERSLGWWHQSPMRKYEPMQMHEIVHIEDGMDVFLKTWYKSSTNPQLIFIHSFHSILLLPLYSASRARVYVIHAPGSLAVACYACILPHIKPGTFLLWPIAGAFFFWLLPLFLRLYRRLPRKNGHAVTEFYVSGPALLRHGIMVNINLKIAILLSHFMHEGRKGRRGHGRWPKLIVYSSKIGRDRIIGSRPKYRSWPIRWSVATDFSVTTQLKISSRPKNRSRPFFRFWTEF